MLEYHHCSFAGMHTNMCIVILISGICSIESYIFSDLLAIISRKLSGIVFNDINMGCNPDSTSLHPILEGAGVKGYLC